MVKQIQKRDASGRNSLVLVFLVTFGILSIIFSWFIYEQFALVYTRPGQCTVLSSQLHQEAVDEDDPTDTASQYFITFQISLLTPEGQHLTVPGYYSSTNYDVSDQNSANAILKRYAVGSTASCGYTYLDPSGVKAIFSPSVALEGFLFPAFFLTISLVIVAICIVTLRRPLPPEVPFPDELSDDYEIIDEPASELPKVSQ
jgi:hypothetical protein